MCISTRTTLLLLKLLSTWFALMSHSRKCEKTVYWWGYYSSGEKKLNFRVSVFWWWCSKSSKREKRNKASVSELTPTGPGSLLGTENKWIVNKTNPQLQEESVLVWKSHTEQVCTDTPRFIALHVIVLHGCCFFCFKQMESKPRWRSRRLEGYVPHVYTTGTTRLHDWHHTSFSHIGIHTNMWVVHCPTSWGLRRH